VPQSIFELLLPAGEGSLQRSPTLAGLGGPLRGGEGEGKERGRERSRRPHCALPCMYLSLSVRPITSRCSNTCRTPSVLLDDLSFSKFFSHSGPALAAAAATAATSTSSYSNTCRSFMTRKTTGRLQTGNHVMQASVTSDHATSGSFVILYS